MLVKTLLSLALLPTLALSNPIEGRRTSDFDLDKLSYREVGARNTLDWRVWLELDGNPISFWHDIPLYPNKKDKNIIHMYVEIPRWTDGKIETKRDEPLNPIFHDDKKKKPRFVYSVWPHKSYPFHYGSIPQTWENPNEEDDVAKVVGDNDPIDVFDISEFPATTGEVKTVKVLGGLAMIDDEKADWKIIVVDTKDPLADVVDSVEDLEKYRPGLSKQFHEWFIYYKVVKGDGLNTIVGNKYQSAKTATKLIKKSHEYWERLQRGKEDPNTINFNQTTNTGYKRTYVSSKKATEKFDIPAESKILPAAERPAEFDQWHYLDGDFNVIQL